MSNAASGVATSVTRDVIGNTWLDEQNDVGKNAIKSTIGGAVFGGLNAGLDGIGHSVEGIPNLAKNASIAGTASIGASVTEDIIGNVAFGENNSIINVRNNAFLRGSIAGGFSLGLNGLGYITNHTSLFEDYDYYDVASYLASRGYSNNTNINVEKDISDEIAKYLVSMQNNRLLNAILDGANLNNYSMNCTRS